MRYKLVGCLSYLPIVSNCTNTVYEKSLVLFLKIVAGGFFCFLNLLKIACIYFTTRREDNSALSYVINVDWAVWVCSNDVRILGLWLSVRKEQVSL